MKPMVLGAAGLAVALSLPTLARAQAKVDFSGKWTYNQALSGPQSSGNSPMVAFPTDLVIKQTPTELDLESSTGRQDVIALVYKLDGAEITVPGPSGITTKAKAKWDGPKLIIDTKRSYSSPMGDVTAEFMETWTIADNVLTIEKTQVNGGITNTRKAVYTKTTS
jgi:hypothetical protein